VLLINPFVRRQAREQWKEAALVEWWTSRGDTITVEPLCHLSPTEQGRSGKRRCPGMLLWNFQMARKSGPVRIFISSHRHRTHAHARYFAPNIALVRKEPKTLAW